MNDKMTELIKNVFDHLESLDEAEFKKNLTSYYEDPLTEILLKANMSADNNDEYLPVPYLNPCDYEQRWKYAMAADNYQSTSFITNTLAAVWGDLSIGSLSRNTLSSNYGFSSGMASVWLDCNAKMDGIFNGSELIDMTDLGYSWAEAA